MRETYIIFLVAFATCLRGGLANDDIPIPEKRLISTFQIVRFPNDNCVGTSSRNGTCYTSAECSDKGGTSSGSCADGFGVCCSFVISSCGQSSSENITYWDQTPTVSKVAPTTCDLKIYPMNENICQLRIDFDAFVISGPSTSTMDENNMHYGTIAVVGVDTESDSNWRSNCLVDMFSVNGVSSSNNPPTICGTNTGYHMYVDAADCNTLSFRFSANAGLKPALKNIATRGLATLATRNWDMKIQQYECGHINAAPPGCTQYYWGETKGKVRSYNYAGGHALANQDQRVCWRRERGVCYICFASTATELNISGMLNAANAYTYPGQACGYAAEAANDATVKSGMGNANNQAGAYDCAIIPGAFVVAKMSDGIFVAIASEANIRSLTTDTYQVPVGPQISSGGVLGPGMATNLNTIVLTGHTNPATTCSKHVPFMFIFKSDGNEGLGVDSEYGDEINAKTNNGIELPWYTVTCT